MADSEKYNSNKKPSSSSSFFSSPRLFTNFTPKGFHETETMMSPTSTLDSKPFSGFKNPFWSETNSPRTPGSENKRYWDKLDSKGVGLGLVDALVDEDKQGEVSSKTESSRMVVFGSQLKIQIPSLPVSPSESESSKFVAEKGNSASGGANNNNNNNNSQRVFMGCLSASEMELSEDYTRVISHGPNPRTTHIFDNCIIESSCFELGCPAKESGCFLDHTNYHSRSFLSVCFHCKKNIGQGKDIYMYRGERAFCSNECRYQGMLLEEEMSKFEANDIYGP